jgi:hypothetical protein
MRAVPPSRPWPRLDEAPAPTIWDVGREHFSFRVRWQIVRRRGRFTWRDWREDLQYLFRG